jgi:glycosyltransferase involved in cell wall biosynthesis
MRLVVTTEHRFYRTPDGSYWTTSAFARPFWERYLDVFEQVRVVARVLAVEEPPANALRSDGENVEFCAIPYYVGPAQFVRQAPWVYDILRHAIDNDDAVIMRVSSLIAAFAHSSLRWRQQLYGVEVVGDPYEVFAPGGVEHPLRPLFRWCFTRAQKSQCWHAVGVAYVTREALQRRYPCKGLEASISDVDISESSVIATPRIYRFRTSTFESSQGPQAASRPDQRSAVSPFRLVLVGSLEQYYKAPDILIAALARLVRAGHNLELVLVGDGKYRNELCALAQDLGVNDRVMFRGLLPAGRAVRDELDAADLFVLPSRTEGLPRAMIEAMARGLPCIGSTVGGIPELLPPEDMVPPGDVSALAEKIREVMVAPERMQTMSKRNLVKAQEYRAEILQKRRHEFYSYLRRATEDWIVNRRR